MTRKIGLVVFLAMTAAYSITPAAGWDLNIGVNVGVPAPPPPVVVAPAPPPPPVVVEAPPQIVVVPGTPVYYAPGVDFNLFVYGGQYYSFHNGVWFVAARHDGPWVFVERDRVPRPVLAVPTTYYRMPPGQAKKMGREEPEGHGRGARGQGVEGPRRKVSRARIFCRVSIWRCAFKAEASDLEPCRSPAGHGGEPRIADSTSAGP